MLVLTRKAGQSIVIGDDVEITLLEIDGGKVRLGITAPQSVPVHRLEVYLAIKSREGESTGVQPGDDSPLRRRAS